MPHDSMASTPRGPRRIVSPSLTPGRVAGEAGRLFAAEPILESCRAMRPRPRATMGGKLAQVRFAPRLVTAWTLCPFAAGASCALLDLDVNKPGGRDPQQKSTRNACRTPPRCGSWRSLRPPPKPLGNGAGRDLLGGRAHWVALLDADELRGPAPSRPRLSAHCGLAGGLVSELGQPQHACSRRMILSLIPCWPQGTFHVSTFAAI